MTELSRPVFHPAKSPIFRLVRNVAASKFVHKILVLWSSASSPPSASAWPRTSSVPLVVTRAADGGVAARFRPDARVETDAVLALDGDAAIGAEEIDFAFGVWTHFRDRIVGFPSRSHFWDSHRQSWTYSSKWTNEYSMVLTGAAFYHKYYNTLYTSGLPPLLHKTVAQVQNCEDILMNFVVSHVTKKAPIKVTQRKRFKQEALPPGISSRRSRPDNFSERQQCLRTFAAVFGYMPLRTSALRLDPVLFKDPVANARKKYRQIELVAAGGEPSADDRH